MFFASLGSYSVGFQSFDPLLLLLLGLLGLSMRRFAIPVLPLIVGVILGPDLAMKLTEALALSNGDVSTLWGEPTAVVVYLVAAALLAVVGFNWLRAQSAAAIDHEKEEVSA